MRRLILIRHGQTHWNQQRRIHGWLDSPVTEKALLQLQKMQLPVLNNPVIFCSDLGRAKQSAEIIASKLALPITIDSRLRERSFGVLQGKVIDHDPHLHHEWASYHHRYQHKLDTVSGVESEDEFAQRIYAFLSDLNMVDARRDVFIVSHGEWLRALSNIICGIPSWHHGKGIVENATAIILEWEGGKSLATAGASCDLFGASKN